MTPSYTPRILGLDPSDLPSALGLTDIGIGLDEGGVRLFVCTTKNPSSPSATETTMAMAQSLGMSTCVVAGEDRLELPTASRAWKAIHYAGYPKSLDEPASLLPAGVMASQLADSIRIVGDNIASYRAKLRAEEKQLDKLEEASYRAYASAWDSVSRSALRGRVGGSKWNALSGSVDKLSSGTDTSQADSARVSADGEASGQLSKSTARITQSQMFSNFKNFLESQRGAEESSVAELLGAMGREKVVRLFRSHAEALGEEQDETVESVMCRPESEFEEALDGWIAEGQRDRAKMMTALGQHRATFSQYLKENPDVADRYGGQAPMTLRQYRNFVRAVEGSEH